MHASIFYAVWYGLYDTLEVLCDKLQPFQTLDLIAAELDYQLCDFTNQIVASLKAYAESIAKRQAESGESGEFGLSEDYSYVDAPMNFTDPQMKARYSIFIEGLRLHI